jgi:hypothetical protein
LKILKGHAVEWVLANSDSKHLIGFFDGDQNVESPLLK